MLVVGLDARPPPPREVVGGKALSLMTMIGAGLPVPPGCVLTTAFFAPWMRALGPELEADPAALQARARRLRFTAAQSAALAEHVDDGVLYAARSSAPDEDRTDASFAGAYESVLGVPRAGLDEAVARVFASRFAERVGVYERARGLDRAAASMAVVIQPMVRADASGVASSIHPTTNDFDQMVVNATVGLGGPLVSGEVTPDELTLSKLDGGVVERRPGRRELCRFLDADGTMREERDLDHVWAVDERTLAEIEERVAAVEALYGRPMEVEWAVADGALSLLQARPMTAWIPLHEAFLTEPGTPRQLWIDFSLIEQGLPRPLTVFGSSVYNWFAMMIDHMIRGVDLATFDNGRALKVARYGRIYVNAGVMARSSGWDRMVSSVGIIDSMAEQILRGVDGRRFRAWKDPAGFPFAALVRVPRLLLASAAALVCPARGARRITARLQAICADARGPRVRSLRDDLVHFVERMSGSMAVLAAVICGRLAVGRLEAMFDDAHAADVRTLTTALPGNITLQLGVDMAHLARTLPDGDWTAEGLAAAAEAGTLPSDWLDRWHAFLRLHGCRGPNEVDAGCPRNHEQPALLTEQILAVRRQPPGQDAATRDQAVQAGRASARRRLRAALPAYRRGWFDACYALALAYGGLRETPKYVQIVVTDRVRRLAREEVAAHVAAGRMDDPDDLRFLTTEHLFAAAADPAYDLRAPIREARAFMATMDSAPALPRVIDSRGRIYRAPARADGAELQGRAISAGRVRGPVRVLHRPDARALQTGDILVTRATDPGWAPLLPLAAGIVLEVGGMLQHGALLAREYGKPCVAGVPRVTEQLRDGMTVELDGAAGTVRILAPAGG